MLASDSCPQVHFFIILLFHLPDKTWNMYLESRHLPWPLVCLDCWRKPLRHTGWSALLCSAPQEGPRCCLPSCHISLTCLLFLSNLQSGYFRNPLFPNPCVCSLYLILHYIFFYSYILVFCSKRQLSCIIVLCVCWVSWIWRFLIFIKFGQIFCHFLQMVISMSTVPSLLYTYIWMLNLPGSISIFLNIVLKFC